MKISISILFLLLALCISASEKDENAAQFDYKSISLNWGNDAIGIIPDDGDLTNVIRIEAESSKIPSILKKIFPEDHNIMSYKLAQNIYTPNDVEEIYEDGEDRPYAGWLYVEIGLYRRTSESRMDIYGVRIGAVGPAAYAGETQEVIHKIIGSGTPIGWDNQLDNEFAFDMFYKRVYSARKELGDFSLEFLPFFSATLGNVHIDGSVGAIARFGYNVPDDMASTTFDAGYEHDYKKQKKNFRAYVFAKGEGSAIGRDIFLDGNTFVDDPRAVDREYFRLSATGGITIGYENVDITFAYNYSTKEFEDQESSQQSGTITLKFSF